MAHKAETDIKVVENILFADLLEGGIDVNKTATRIVSALQMAHAINKTHSKNTDDAE